MRRPVGDEAVGRHRVRPSGLFAGDSPAVTADSAGITGDQGGQPLRLVGEEFIG